MKLKKKAPEQDPAKPDMRITFDNYAELMPLAKLKKSKHQRNKHPKDQIERLAKIMDAHGVRHPIHISKLSGQVCFGHGRWEAARLNGYDHYPIVYQEFKDEDEEYACVQSDNAIAHWAELDLASINNDLGNLGPDFDIDLLGIKDFVLEPAEKFEAQCDEDEVPEVTDTRCKLGDVWTLGKHRLVCGDSTDVCAVDLLMGGEKADMVFTDPPYGMNAVSKSGVLSANKKYRGDIMNDDTTEVAKDAYRLCAGLDVPKLVFWGANYYASALPDATCWLVWDKNNGQSDQMDCELAWTNLKGVTRQFTKASEKSNRVHPTQKPVELIQWCLERYDAGDVLDLFGGSGSTLIACEKTNRRCFMMELDPHYCDVILARWEKYTGKVAELDNGKEAGPSKISGRTAKDTVKRRAGKKPSRDQLLSR